MPTVEDTATLPTLTPDQLLYAKKAVVLALSMAHDMAVATALRCTAQTASEFRKAAVLCVTQIASIESIPDRPALNPL